LEVPLNAARYLMTLRDAAPEVAEAYEQILWGERPSNGLHAEGVASPMPGQGNGHAPVADELPHHGLTHREIEVLVLIAGSRSNLEIAGDLGISLNTVERHIANIYRKLHIRGRVHATAYALQHGLTPPYNP
jgi:DNA-binding CsgD family transcriptional regulator